MRKLITTIIIFALAFCAVSATHAAMQSSTEVTGTGDTVYIELGIHDVILPTAGSLDFMLDPQGLLSLAEGQSAPLEALNGGRIVHMNDARIINNSAHTVKVSVELWAACDNGGGSLGTIATFIEYTGDDAATIGAVEASGSEENNILLYAVPSATNLANQAAPFVPADTGYIITAASRTLDFILPAALYSITANSDGSLLSEPVPDTGSGIAFQLGGYVNTNADWSDFRTEYGLSTVTVYATYTLAEAAFDELSSHDASRVHGAPNMLPPLPANALQTNRQ